MNHIEHSLSEEEINSFNLNGFFGPFKVYDPEEIAAEWKKLRIELHDRDFAPYDIEPSSGLSIGNYDRHLDVSFLSRHIMRPQIVSKLRSVLGPDILNWRTEFFPKYPNEKGTPWHQNSTFEAASGKVQLQWPEGSKENGAITVWCAFTDSTIDNGCLKLMPRTQYTRFYNEKKGFTREKVVPGFGYDFKEIRYDSNWEPDEKKAFPLVMKAGECVAFWSTLLHGSHPNISRNMRLGFASRYVPTKVQIYPETKILAEFGETTSLKKWSAVLVSGTDKFGHNKIKERNLKGELFSSFK